MAISSAPIVFELDPALPPKPALPQFPTGWFAKPNTSNRRPVKYHYNPGTGRSVCGISYSNGVLVEERAYEHPDNCQRCARGRHLLGVVSP